VSESNGVRVILIPEDGRDSVTVHLSRRRLRLLVVLGVVAVAGVALMVGTWWYMAARAYQVPRLEAEVAQMREGQQQLSSLVGQLETLEERYGRIQSMFGIDTAQILPELWRPPATGSRSAEQDPQGSLPTSWPLTQPGFVTQSLLDGSEGEHPGLDIATASGSYIRAAGAGVVEDTGNDAVYGNFVTIDHGDGYLTLYAHASAVFVEVGRRVQRNEVIALTGTTGRSTAPHLHFEIRLNDDTVDPLTLLDVPN